jgi:L-alanine-DL-glutamate epimerase-like enolase superfamily enzyme
LKSPVIAFTSIPRSTRVGTPRTFWDAAIVAVHTDLGVSGYGSGDMMLGFEGHEPLSVGHDGLALERRWRILNNINFHGGRCWLLDLALWDLAGKVAGQPCRKLIGGLSDRVRAYASSGMLRGSEALADTAERYIARGFAAMKIRFHRGDWRADIRALEAVRERVGDRLELMVGAWRGTPIRHGRSKTQYALRGNSNALASTRRRSLCIAAIATARGRCAV